MSDGPLVPTTSAVWTLLHAPRFWTLLAAALLTLALGTVEDPSLPLRLVYSLAMAAVAMGTTIEIVRLLFRFVDRYGALFPLQMAGIGFVAGVPVAVFVAAANAALYSESLSFRDEFSGVVPYLCLVASGISFTFGLVMTEKADPAALERARRRRDYRRPALLDRLPPHLRGPLSHLSIRDRHVEVFTDKGSSLVPMRMADAIRETAGVDGVQVHLFHWVAHNAVERTGHWDGQMFVVLRDGTRLPVSRSRQEAVRDAGLA